MWLGECADHAPDRHLCDCRLMRMPATTLSMSVRLSACARVSSAPSSRANIMVLGRMRKANISAMRVAGLEVPPLASKRNHALSGCQTGVPQGACLLNQIGWWCGGAACLVCRPGARRTGRQTAGAGARCWARRTSRPRAAPPAASPGGAASSSSGTSAARCGACRRPPSRHGLLAAGHRHTRFGAGTGRIVASRDA